MKSKRFPIGTGGGRHPERIETKRREATERNRAWAELGAREQLRVLDKRGLTARRQRARISRELGR